LDGLAQEEAQWEKILALKYVGMVMTFYNMAVMIVMF